MRIRFSPVVAICLLVATFLVAGVEAAELPKAKPVTIGIPKVDLPVTIDGHLGDAAWASAYRTSIPLLLLEESLARANDVSGEGQVFWNENGLFVSLRVDDRKQYFVDDGGTLREYDSVEVWLEKLWIQVGFSKKGETKVNVVDMSFTSLFTDAVTAAVRRSNTGYTVEICIPNDTARAALGYDLQQGRTVRLAFGINNRYRADEPARTRHYFPNRYAWNNPTESFAVGTLK